MGLEVKRIAEDVAWMLGGFGAGLMAPAIYAAQLSAVAPTASLQLLEGVLFLVGLVLWIAGGAIVMLLDYADDFKEDVEALKNWLMARLRREEAEPQQLDLEFPEEEEEGELEDELEEWEVL